MDSKIKPKSSIATAHFDMQLDEIEAQADSQDKRLVLYKGLREKFLLSLKSEQEQDHKLRMEELNKKIELLEKQMKLKEMSEREKADAKEQERGEKNKGFLGGIKSFQVEDI